MSTDATDATASTDPSPVNGHPLEEVRVAEAASRSEHLAVWISPPELTGRGAARHLELRGAEDQVYVRATAWPGAAPRSDLPPTPATATVVSPAA